jgi:hypothetical protein
MIDNEDVIGWRRKRPLEEPPPSHQKVLLKARFGSLEE